MVTTFTIDDMSIVSKEMLDELMRNYRKSLEDAEIDEEFLSDTMVDTIMNGLEIQIVPLCQFVDTTIKVTQAEESPKPEPIRYEVYTTGVTGVIPAKKINMIKALRSVSGIGLKEAKDAIEVADSAFVECGLVLTLDSYYPAMYVYNSFKENGYNGFVLKVEDGKKSVELGTAPEKWAKDNIDDKDDLDVGSLLELWSKLSRQSEAETPWYMRRVDSSYTRPTRSNWFDQD